MLIFCAFFSNIPFTMASFKSILAIFFFGINLVTLICISIVFAKVKPNTQFIGQNIIYFNQVDSTNKFAFELNKQNLAENGTVVLAEYQTEGRGQFNREWISKPYQNLMFSIILKHVTKVPSSPFIVNKMLTLTMCQCIQDYLPGQEVHIKWPNDIFVNKRKICGILVENNYSGQQLNYSILGIGLNVNQDFSRHQLNATSLKNEAGHFKDRPEILKYILERIEANYLSLPRAMHDIEDQYNQNLMGYNRIASFLIQDKSVEATVVACDREGRLVLNIQGENRAFLHGEVKQVIDE